MAGYANIFLTISDGVAISLHENETTVCSTTAWQAATD